MRFYHRGWLIYLFIIIIVIVLLFILLSTIDDKSNLFVEKSSDLYMQFFVPPSFYNKSLLFVCLFVWFPWTLISILLFPNFCRSALYIYSSEMMKNAMCWRGAYLAGLSIITLFKDIQGFIAVETQWKSFWCTQRGIASQNWTKSKLYKCHIYSRRKCRLNSSPCKLSNDVTAITTPLLQ